MKGRDRPWSEIDDQVLRQLHANGWTLGDIANFMVCGKVRIRERASALGIEFGEYHQWTPEEDAAMRRRYPDEPSADIARDLGLDVSQIHTHAKAMGLKKSEVFLASDKAGRIQRGRPDPRMRARQFKKGHVPANKGKRRPGWATGRMRETQFKSGRPAIEAHNYVPIGTEKVEPKRKCLMRKVTDDPTIFPVKRWRPVHVLVWEAANGPVPKGHIVVFKPGQKTFVSSEITLDRIEIVSLAEHMRRNTVHNLPAELVDVIYLKGRVQRQINKRERQREEQD